MRAESNDSMRTLGSGWSVTYLFLDRFVAFARLVTDFFLVFYDFFGAVAATMEYDCRISSLVSAAARASNRSAITHL